MAVLMRYVLAWMGALGIMNVYFCRINLSTAIVAMVGVDNRGVTSNNVSDICPDRDIQTSIVLNSSLSGGEFDWSKQEQGLVLGSYYWSYTAAQIPAAWLATRYGFRLVFGVSMLFSGLITLLFPVCAHGHVNLALLARVLIGLFHAVSFPAMTGAWGAWAPPLEITKLQGIFWSGASIGTLIIFTLAGYIADNLGWEAVFYVTGSLSLVWVVFWFLLVADTPAEHPRISQEERNYIESSIGQSADLNRKKLVTPWKDILTSVPVWGIVLGHTASNWGNYTLNQQLPTYLSNVLRYSLSFNGLLSSLCYLIQWLVCLFGSWLTDLIRSKQLLATLTIRKINTILGLWVTGACGVLAVYSGCNAELAVTLFALAAGLNLLTVPGCKSGFMDIAPDYSGVSFSLANTFGNIPGFVGPAVVGSLLTDYSDISQWQSVFWISAGVHIIGSGVYLIWGSDQVQSWAKPKQSQPNSCEPINNNDSNNDVIKTQL